MVKYKIGDILENPWAPSNPYNKFVYIGVNGNFISIIRFDGKKIFLNKQGFYKNDILHPEWQHDPEGREFKVIGHSKAFELLKEELSSGVRTND